MSLRKKTLITISITLTIMVFFIYLFTSVILLDGYKGLEGQDILHDATQAEKIIIAEMCQLKSVVGDWAPWDDTYQFIQNENPAYVINNLMDSVLINLNISFLIFINTNGEIIHCSHVNLESGNGKSCPAALRDYITATPSLLRDEQHLNTLAGLALLPENPVFLAAAPILTSQFKGPVMGTLVAGRYLNETEIKKIADKLNLCISFHRLDDPELPDEIKRGGQWQASSDTDTVIKHYEDTIAAYTMLTDYNDRPALIFRIEKIRSIYRQGKTSMYSLIFSMLAISVMFIIVVMLLLERTILSRILQLSHEIKHIETTGNLLDRTTVSGKDELADLSVQINRMLESLRVSTERDLVILDSIEDAYFEFDLEGNLVFFNQYAATLMKDRITDLKNLNYRHLIDNDTLDQVDDAFNQLYKTGEPIKGLETQLIFKNGDKKLLESRVSLIKDTEGKRTGFRGIARDITERKNAEERLKKSEQRLSLALEVSLAGLWEANLATKEFSFDKKLFHAFGYFTEDFPKEITDIINFIDPQDAPRARRCFLTFIKGVSSFYRDDFQVLTKTGEKRWIHNRARAIEHFDDNRPKMIIGTAIDITDLKRAEKELRDNEERYRTILENQKIGYFETDLSGNFLFFNNALCALTEYDSYQLQGLNYNAYTDAETAQKLEALYKTIFQTGKPLSGIEYSVVTKNNRQITLETSISLIKDPNENPVGFCGLAMDITDKKNAEIAKRNAERENRQAHKMEAIGTLAGGIAHDFNNILTSIFGYAQLAKNAIHIPAKAEGHIDQIMKGAGRAAGLIQQILTFSRQKEQEKILINIAMVVKEAVHLMRASIPTTIDIQENIFSKANVSTDPTRIHQLIMNLCTNAYHAMRNQGGVLTVELSDVYLPDYQSYPEINLPAGDYVQITVKDTGCGMDEDTLQKVFDPYFTTKPIGEGTGLGLSIVYGIVEDHDGLIKAYSSENQGAVFRIFLPVAKETATLKEAGPKLVTPGNNETVMLVDDEEGILLSVQQNLQNHGYRVRAFSNPEEALKAFKENPSLVDLLITDMTMPGMTGDLLAKDVLKIRPGMPVILCTGYSEKISDAKAFKMGVRRFLQKPLGINKLLQIVREVLDEPSKF